ncbi:MAG TPA: hypothetical protein VK821_11620 [Dehalococcoidia bacterium]|nr:hypothetical protein [Dehalococcoidia bacterium]
MVARSTRRLETAGLRSLAYGSGHLDQCFTLHISSQMILDGEPTVNLVTVPTEEAAVKSVTIGPKSVEEVPDLVIDVRRVTFGDFLL